MDATTKSKIEECIWDWTIGSGRWSTPDDCEGEPDQDAMEALTCVLGRKLTGDEVECAVQAWSKCETEFSSP